MNILIVLPQIQKVKLIEPTAKAEFFGHLDSLVEGIKKSKHKIFFLAEDSSARLLRDDIPNARFIRITAVEDDPIVALYESTQQFAIPKGFDCLDYSSAAKDIQLGSEEGFYNYYRNQLQSAYKGIRQNFQLIVEYSMPKKSMTVYSEDIPISSYFYKYDILKSKSEFYAGGQLCPLEITDILKQQ